MPTSKAVREGNFLAVVAPMASRESIPVGGERFSCWRSLRERFPSCRNQREADEESAAALEVAASRLAIDIPRCRGDAKLRKAKVVTRFGRRKKWRAVRRTP